MAAAPRRFEGKVALVTGGSSGIGRATALAFAHEGASVVIACRGRARGEQALEQLRATGAPAELVVADVSRSDEVDALMRHTVEHFGRLDCAFNNAASVPDDETKPLVELTEQDFDAAIARNLKSVWLCLRAELRQLVAQGGGGAIVNTSSINGLGGVPQAGPYAAAKAGVLALTKTAALEHAAAGIRVNALVAGAFDTPMLRGVFERVSPADPAAAEAAFSGMIPVGRIGRPEEAADAVLWLCADTNTYVTGHSLIVDGGFTCPHR